MVKNIALKHPVLHSNQSKKIEFPAANSVDSDAKSVPQDPCSSQRTGTTPHHMVGHAKNVPGSEHTFSLGSGGHCAGGGGGTKYFVNTDGLNQAQQAQLRPFDFNLQTCWFLILRE